MKRVLMVVLLATIGLSGAGTLFSAPAHAVQQLAAGTPNCNLAAVNDNDSCSVLIVHLTTTAGTIPSSGITVEAVRKVNYTVDNDFLLLNRPPLGNPQYADYRNTVKFTDDSTYTSMNGIYGTGPNTPCYMNPTGDIGGGHKSSDIGLFVVTVSGPALSAPTTITVDVCNQMTKQVSVGISLKSAPSPTGGLTGKTTYINDLNGATGNCTNVSFVDIWGGPDNIPRNKPIQMFTSNGRFTTDLSLKAGAYNLHINCYDGSTNGASQLYLGSTVATVVGGRLTLIHDFENLRRAGENDPNLPASNAPPPPKCTAGALTWVVCPLIVAADSVIKSIEGVVKKELTFSPLDPAGEPGLHAVWSSFRNLADIFFVLIFMLVIFGTAFGFDNYTVKRMLPRLIAAAILIQFSYLLLGLAVDVTNVLGNGIDSLVTLIPGGDQQQTSTMATIGFLEAGGLLGVGVIAVLTAGLAIPVLLAVVSLMIGLFVVFVTLQLRIILLQLLIVVAPVAILAWVLPNTEKWFKKWRNLTLDLLMMFPLIMLLFLAGNIVSLVTSNSNDDTLQQVLGAISPIIVFFLVPVTFKLASGALGAVSSMIGGKNGLGRARSGLKGARDGYMQRRGEDKKEGAINRLGRVQEQGGPQGLGQKIQTRRDMRKAGFGFTPKETNINRLSENPMRDARLASAVIQSDHAREKSALRNFEAKGTGATELIALLTNAKTDTPIMKAAIERLTATEQWEEFSNNHDAIISTIAAKKKLNVTNADGSLRKYEYEADGVTIKKDANGNNVKNADLATAEGLYSDLLGNNFGDIKAKSAVSLAGMAGLAGMTAAQLTTQRSDTFKKYAEVIATGEATPAELTLETALRQNQNSSGSRARWVADNGRTLLNQLTVQAEAARKAGDTTTATRLEATKTRYLTNYFNADGSLHAAPNNPAVAPTARPTTTQPAPTPATPTTTPGPATSTAHAVAPSTPPVPPPTPPAQPPTSGGLGASPAPGAPRAGRNPRVSERLVDPRVEGDADEQLR